MNYIQYLADARLINLVYPNGESFPKKPSRVLMHNSNLVYSIYPSIADTQEVLETFFVNTLWKDHKVNRGDKNSSFVVDGEIPFKISPKRPLKNMHGLLYAVNDERGSENVIPLWLLGFLY